MTDRTEAELQAEIERLWAKVHAEQEQVSRRHEKQRAAEARLDALVADLRGLADAWESLGATPVAWHWDKLGERLRAVLDKHAGDRPSGRERLRAVNAAVAADRAEPETMTVRAFLFRYKRGSIFPAAALTEAIEALPEEMRTERRTWEQWQDEFEPMGLERKPDPGRATEGRFEVAHPESVDDGTRVARANFGDKVVDGLLEHFGARRAECHADRDGECHWAECPQLRDGEPVATGRHCPLDLGDEQ